DSIDVREWHVTVPLNGVTIRASGSLRTTPGTDGYVGFEGDFAADEAKGGFAGDYNSGSQTLVLRIEEALITPEGLPAILRSMSEGNAASGISFGWERAAVNAEITLKSGDLSQAKANVQLAEGTVTRGDTGGELAAATIEILWKIGEPLAIEFDGAGVALNAGSTRIVAETMQFFGSDRGGSVSLGNAVVTSGEREVRGHGLGSFTLGEGTAALSAEGTWILESAKFDGFTAGGAEVTFDWEDGVLSAMTTGLAINGPVAADFEELEMAVSNLTSDAPGVSGRVVAAVDIASALPKGAEMIPARERVTANFLGLLGAGRESMRIEFEFADTTRAIKSPEFGGGFTGALAGVVTLDSSYVSGSIAGEWKDVSLSIPGQGSAMFPEANFKWTTGRVWTDSIRGWSHNEPARVLRELLWVSTIDLRASGGAVDLAELGNASGVAATVVSDGADISELAGASLVVSAKSVHAADREFADFGAILGFGLDGGTVVADITLASPRVPVRSRQSLNWGDGFTFNGTYSTEVIDLASAGSFGGLAPELEGITASGKASVSGALRLGPNGFEAGARVEFESAGFVWPGDQYAFSGISGVVDLDSLRPLHAGDGQRITIATAKFKDITFTDGTVEFGIPAADSMSVTRLDARTLGGKLAAAPFAFDPRDPKPETRIRLDGLRLNEVLAFFPDVPATAEGRIVGEIPVAWDGERVAFGAGYIDLQPGELGHVTFDYDIRVLTQGRQPDQFMYAALRRVEKAIRDLHFDRLRIDLHPTGTPGRSMQIRMAGVPTTDDVRAPVELDINIDAPLDRFIKWGTNPVKP
ncbi:MAG TPA: YdbH domain-containing protein, partial [Gammaproteobacteria bacterium]|nr:YdbH domain-containing protein [Gammaproteobacteria bacterium]